MKIVSYRSGDSWRAGAVIADDIYDIGHALETVDGKDESEHFTVRDLLNDHGAHLPLLGPTVAAAVRQGLASAGPAKNAVLAAPVANPGKVLCIGLNYRDHVAETGRALPEFPDVFAKFASSLTGPNDPVAALWATDQLDFEGELAVVIGQRTQRVSEAEALNHVAGVMVLNDITARDLQYRGTQWLMGKAVDASTPSGPALVTLDEVGDVQQLELTTTVNGVEVQRSNTRNMIFTVAHIIAYLSATITLEPGDIIATGTPEGVGAKRTPPLWLQDGDEVAVEIERVGRLLSVIRAASD